MAKPASVAQRNWEAKTSNAGAAWEASKGRMTSEWPRGVAETFGSPPGPTASRNYSEGIGRVSAGEFQASIAGKGSKWLENTRRGLAR